MGMVFPAMGCGTWSWGNRLLWDYDPTMDDQLQEVFNLCVRSGVTFFDTADSYGTGKLKGQSEILLGKFSQAYQGINADQICLATKLAPYATRLTRNSMVNAGLEAKLRLQRPIDLVQMHWPTTNYAPWQEDRLLDGLADLYDRGEAKGVGLSNYGPKRLLQVHAKLKARNVPILSLQVQYSLLSTYPVTTLDLKTVCDDLGVKAIAYSPLALGLLTGKYRENKPMPKGVRGLLFKQLVPKIKPMLDCLGAIATQREKAMAQVALNWTMQKGFMPIPGAKSPEQAAQNIGALGWSLDAGEMADLDRASAQSKQVVQNIFQTK
jgi:pyridoxine 4-dehydrogenase